MAGLTILPDDADVAFINSYIEESHDAAFRCRRTKEKGRMLLARRNFEAGEIVLEAAPLRVVRCEPLNPTYRRLVEWQRRETADLAPLWYWCALKSLTVEDLGPQHLEEARGGWDPMPPGAQELLLRLHQAPKPNSSPTLQSLAEHFAPGLKDVSVLERCLDAWVLNCFDLVGDDDPEVDPDTKEQPGQVALFLPSMLSHSCFPTGVWHWCIEYSSPPDNRQEGSEQQGGSSNGNSTNSKQSNTSTPDPKGKPEPERSVASTTTAKTLAERVRDRDERLRWLLKARRPIRAGAEVTISYLDDTMLLDHCRVRRNELSRRDFWCHCERCVDGVDLSRSMRCGRCQEGVIYAKRPSSLEGGSLASDLARPPPNDEPIPLTTSLLRSLRPAIYDEICAADLDNWLTMGTPFLARNAGKLYYEVALGSGCAEPQIGWASTRFQEHSNWIGSGVGDDDESWGADGSRGLFWHGAVQEEVAMEFPKGDWQEGDVIGCALDFEQGIMSFSENGAWSSTMRQEFRADGRWLYPAMSLQGNFLLLLQRDALRHSPPSEDYTPWIEDSRARGALDRRGPLRFAYIGCCCDKCGHEVNAEESSRLTDLEQELFQLADPKANPKPALTEEEVQRICHLAERDFAWHSLVNRARERLQVHYASLRDYDAQTKLWERSLDFARRAYPAACGAHAWGQSGLCGVALKDGAAKLFEVKKHFDPQPRCEDPKWKEEPDLKNEIRGQLGQIEARTRLAADEAKAAYNTLVMMFGETHTWATEVQDQLVDADSLLMEVKSLLDLLQKLSD